MTAALSLTLVVSAIDTTTVTHGRVGVIEDGGNSLSSARGDHGGGFVDGFGAVRVVERRDFFAGPARHAIRCGAAAGAIYRRARFAERQSDAAADAACCARDQSDATGKIGWLVSVWIFHGEPPSGPGNSKQTFTNVKLKVNGHSVILSAV